jgi:hypothetical protein
MSLMHATYSIHLTLLDFIILYWPTGTMTDGMQRQTERIQQAPEAD